MDFRFWISLLGVLLIALSTAFIWFLLRKKESKSQLLPTLGFDALEPSLKAVYIKCTLWEVKRSQKGEMNKRLGREFRRTIFELQTLSFPNPTPLEDIQALEQLINSDPEDDEAYVSLLSRVKQFRNQKKEPKGSDDFGNLNSTLEVEA